MRAAILDYGSGNLHSLARAVRSSGSVPIITADVKEALACDVLLLPGVGAFGSAAASIASRLDVLRSALSEGMPCLGICLGMQLLFDSSEEGEGQGLGVIAGSVRRMRTERVPHMGWNSLDGRRDPILLQSELETAYFANSYACVPADMSVVTAWSVHESERFPAAVRAGNVVGVQFHPEKSSSAGVRLVAAFLEEARK